MVEDREDRGGAQNNAHGVDTERDDAVDYGRELVEGAGAGRRASEAYQDLCLGLETLQVKQVNELLRLTLGRKGA